MQLIYRGEMIDYNPPALQPYQKPCALNWRYHAPGETYSEMPALRQASAPRAINWRWQSL